LFNTTTRRIRRRRCFSLRHISHAHLFFDIFFEEEEANFFFFWSNCFVVFFKRISQTDSRKIFKKRDQRRRKKERTSPQKSFESFFEKRSVYARKEEVN
jgi:hypothetical protein